MLARRVGFGAPRRGRSLARLINHDAYGDDYIKKILGETSTVACVGLSSKWNRPSNFAMKYLMDKGYRVIPVNPAEVKKGVKEILGQKVYSSLSEIEEPIDMVDVFRNSEAALDITREAIEIGAKSVWMQLEVRNDEAAAEAEAAGLNVVMNRCPKIEFSRLFGELGWHGFNTGVISSKKNPVGRATTTSSMTADDVGFETLCIHAGARPDPVTGARSTPIYQTTSYVFDDVEHAANLFNLSTFGNIYSRLSNPTVAALEERIATLEGGRGGTCVSSGHAAQLLALFTLMQPGDKMVASDKLYGGSVTQFAKTIRKFGWECIFVNVDDHAQVRDACQEPGVKLLWAESIANPGGIISDLEALAQICDDSQIPFVVDNTAATPYLCKPIDYGATLVAHSTTKYLSGHGTAMGGCVVDSGHFDWSCGGDTSKFPSLAQPEPGYHGITFYETFGDLAFTTFAHAVGLRDLGPTMAPQNAFYTISGIETLPLRMERHCANAQKVAEFLESHPKVKWVSYAGLPSSPYYELGKRYCPKGTSSLFTFGIHGGYEAGVELVEGCQLLSHLANLGDARSLVLHPASTTHRQLTDEQRVACGAGDDVVRLSIGIETADDIIADLANALDGVSVRS